MIGQTIVYGITTVCAVLFVSMVVHVLISGLTKYGNFRPQLAGIVIVYLAVPITIALLYAIGKITLWLLGMVA